CGADAPDARVDPVAAGAPPRPDAYPYASYPYGGFGQVNGCMRCHVAAETESTFSALRNITGTPDLLQYVVTPPRLTPRTPTPSSPATPAAGPPVADPGFLALFPPVTSRAPDPARLALPPVIFDTVVAGPDGNDQFLTSNQCQTCHGGLSTPPFGPVLFVSHAPDADTVSPHRAGTQTDDDTGGLAGVNLSPYGEWRWSLMGLAGRDPVFFSQLEGETLEHPTVAAPVQTLCLSCHGVMGQRQHALDLAPGTPPCAAPGDAACFGIADVMAKTPTGALARDGISCAVCHQMAPYERLQDVDYGRFTLTRGAIAGPFEDPAAYAMEAALGLKAEARDFIRSSEVCASCHTIRLPILDAAGRYAAVEEGGVAYQQAFFEQATYLEWKNSAFAGDGAEARTCQQCHMPDRYPSTAAEPLTSKIAVIQDQSYPYFDHLAPAADLTVPVRTGVARHTLHGLNVFTLAMFDQMDEVLGVAKTDYMTGSTTDLAFAIEGAAALGREETATVEIASARVGPAPDGTRALDVRVTVTNRSGHRFPTGVGFRRAFLALEVFDADGALLWASGRTNALGVIVDGEGTPLPSEFFDGTPQAWQPHHDVITRQDQAQIYEELVRNPQGRFTTSFLSLCETVKDNRLLPKGWSAEGPADFPTYASRLSTRADRPSPTPCEARTSLTATYPAGVGGDARYADGSGMDEVAYRIPADALPASAGALRVRAALYYQALPPAYLKDRFDLGRGAPDAVQIERLHYLTSRLALAGTPGQDWKLLVAEAERPVR
ncbi:MAG: hypothetical protein ACLGHP_01450, partial [Vicinamibacteria bacterium]